MVGLVKGLREQSSRRAFPAVWRTPGNRGRRCVAMCEGSEVAPSAVTCAAPDTRCTGLRLCRLLLLLM